MMPRCSAHGCRNSSEGADGSVTFHPFPAQPEAAEHWAGLCGASGQERTQLRRDIEQGSSGKYFICSLHFEDGALERNPAGECTLRQGAEPTLFPSSPPERPPDKALEHTAQADGLSPAPGPQASAAPCTSRSASRTSRTTQVPDSSESPEAGISSADIGTRVPLCTPEPAVLHPQPGVGQIVLNFREQSNGLSLDSVPSESVSQCHAGCHSLQRVAKQIVLLFLDRPCESAKQTSQDPPLTVSSRTQTEGTRKHGQPHYPPSQQDSQVPSQTCQELMCSSTHTECSRRPEGLNHPPSHPQALYQSCPDQVHTLPSSNLGDGTRRRLEVKYQSPNPEIQISPELRLNSGRTDDSATPSGVMDSPGKLAQSPTHLLIHQPPESETQTLMSCQEPAQIISSSTQTEATITHPLPPTPENQLFPKSFQCSSTQTEPPHNSDVGTQRSSRTDPILTLDSWTQTPRTDEQRPGQLRESPPCSHNHQRCLPPSLTQYVGNLLEHHQVSLQVPELPPLIPPSTAPPCLPQHRVRQIVLNFLEPDSRPVTQDPPIAGTSSGLPSPEIPTQKHQETQTGEELLQPLSGLKEKSGRPLCCARRPPQSRSCPPTLNACLTSPIPQQEERRLRATISNASVPQLCCDVLERKVTFDDIVIYFSKEEWEMLRGDERGLYREVMADNVQSLLSLGLLAEKPDLMSRIEREEEDLWEDRITGRRPRHQDLGTDDGLRLLDNDGITADAGRESVESSSHLGALMRLVNEIPGFLLGDSVTDGGSSPSRSLEDHENIRPCSEVKTEESSLPCTPAPVPSPHRVVTAEMASGLGLPRDTELRHSRVTVKVEEKVAVSPSSSHGAPFSPPRISSLCIKRDPGSSAECVQEGPQIKQEEVPAAAAPAHSYIGQQKPRTSHLPFCPGPRVPHTLDNGKRSSSRATTSTWAILPQNRSMGTFPRNPSISPSSLCDGTNSAELSDLKIKVKQEDSGSERESPLGGRKVHKSPMSSPSTTRLPEREHWRPRSSPRRSPADNILLGTSPLHRLVNCLKEISAGRPRGHNTALTSVHWGTDTNQICTEAPVRVSGALGPRVPEIPATKPNPFTVAVTNGTGWLKGRETKTAESRSTGPSRDETKPSVTPSGLGNCLYRFPTRVPSGQNMGSDGFQRTEEPRRPELGVKRTHSDDLTRLPGVMSAAKRPAMEASARAASSCSPSRYDMWRPLGELQRPPADDQPIGKSHLMSVMDCVRKIPSCRPNPPICGPDPDLSRTCTQSSSTEGKLITVKEEKGLSPCLPASSQWLQPPHHPDTPEPPGSAATNVHLSGLMRLMEEIPCADSSSSSRAMYSIAVGQALAKRSERHHYCNDDGSFQSELNENTIASVDSVFSDDTSWSSENVDPSYSAIGGLQKVVSEFAELTSISPLVAVTAPTISTSTQEANGQKKSKESMTTPVSRLSESVRRSIRDAPGGAASACSAENGAAAYAALCGLQKVVHGFVEQECVSPISAVRHNPPNTSLRDHPGRRQAYPEEEAESPRHQGFSPAPTSRFLCDNGNWMSETDSSYSALSGLQKVVNGFSEMSCVSPFSAVSTTASEPPTQDSSYSTPSGLKKVINGVPDTGCMSPVTVASNLSSEGEPDPGVKRRCDRDNKSWKFPAERQTLASNTISTHNDSGHSHDSYCSARKSPGSSSHCIDLTQEEEPHCAKSRLSTQENQRKTQIREELSSSQSLGNRTSGQCIDLTEEEETLTKPKVFSSGVPGTFSHSAILSSDSPQKRSLADKKHRPCIDLTQAQSVRVNKVLDPGPSGPIRGGVPVVNEHLSGLEKLLKGVPTFTSTTNASAQKCSGSWWFKSTSPHET